MTRGDTSSTEYFSGAYAPYSRFIDQMKQISDGFEKWRYAHEENGAQTYDSSFALAFIEAVASTADDKR